MQAKKEMRPRKKNCLFPVMVRKKRVGRSVKIKFLDSFFGPKCLLYACFTLIGSWEGTVGLQETNNFF